MAFPTSPTNGQRAQEGGLWFTWKDCASGTGAWERDRNQLSFYDPIPIGSIMAFGTSQTPTGWLLCDGTTHQASAYPELFAVLVGNVLPAPTTFTVPDLRGEFLRGRSSNTAQLLSHVDWTTGKPKAGWSVADHKHSGAIKTGTNWYQVYQRTGGTWPSESIGNDRTGETNDASISVDGGDTETAPDHTLVDYYIKASHAKVALPASGFLANVNGSLHDGDVWIFDAVSNEFKNVPSSTLVSGMTVGGTAPTGPFTGQLWYETSGSTPGLRVYDGAKWVYSTGAGTFNTGAVVKIPGYFNKVPTLTDAPQDVVGVAASYNAQKVSLYSYKAGVFHRLLPYTGDPANAGKALVSDANGEPTWAAAGSPVTVTFDTLTDRNGAEDVQSGAVDLPTPPTKFMKFSGVGMSLTTGSRAMIILQNNNGWVDWSSIINTGQAHCTYDTGGTRYDTAALKGWWSDASGGSIIPDTSTYKLQAGSPWFVEGSMYFCGSNRTEWIIKTNYTSDNNTPMICTMRVNAPTKDLHLINSFGFKNTAGNGYFSGEITYL